MRLIYDAGSNEVVTVENIVFRGGRVTADIGEAIAEKIVAQPHLRIRAATKAEIAAKDGLDSAAAVAAGDEPVHTAAQLKRMNKDELLAIAGALELETEGMTKDEVIEEILGNQA